MTRPLVSYVVPTLNRGRYVVRAVQSCLDTEGPADVEVVVLDSRSDDGSFEALEAAFGSDPRVKLLQNERGLGPTRSWLDGCEHVTGDYATFVWSDDYLSSAFLEVLLPPLLAGGTVAYGDGAIRDIDDETPLATEGTTRGVDPDALLRAYHLRWRSREPLPVSPASSLFARAPFDAWRAAAPDWCQRTPLRNTVLWRRAIGPDLMLYFAALVASPGAVQVSTRPVAQFSNHADSITVSSKRWPYEAGYWLARLWALEQFPAATPADRRRYARPAAMAFAFGVILSLAASGSGVERAGPQALEELKGLLAQARRRGVLGAVITRAAIELAAYGFGLVGWGLRRIARR